MILIDKENIAHLTGVERLTSKGAYGDNWLCSIWKEDNASLVYENSPEPWSPGCWKWDEAKHKWKMVALPEGYFEWIFARIDEDRNHRIAQGKRYAFPDGEGTVQLRDERDVINVNAVGTSAMMLVAAEDVTTLLDFRDQEDVTHQLTGAEALAMAQSVMAWISDHYAAAWAHKDAIKALAEAQDYSTLSGYDILQNWPEES